jgi:hypothetical protein
MMQHMTGIPAISYFSSLKLYFTENPVRFIDAFVVLALQTIGFSVQTIKGKVA